MENELITIREAELKAKLARLQESIAAIEQELSELEIAKGVLARLSIKKPAAVVATALTSAAPRSGAAKISQKKPEGLPSIKNLVLEALMDARQRGAAGMAPKDIREFVSTRYSYEMGSSANTVPSRMWRDEKLIDKNTETGLFSLPEKEKPVDVPGKEVSSTGLISNPEQVRRAGPGGGP
ncbi:hypothetical protein ABCW43_26710 [Neorhizobium sp. IRAMC:178]|uniref:hypothetical protein n=1 Tax=Neorhizobium tunisiense TaxID=3144793 RepID=UPI0031F6A263